MIVDREEAREIRSRAFVRRAPLWSPSMWEVTQALFAWLKHAADVVRAMAGAITKAIVAMFENVRVAAPYIEHSHWRKRQRYHIRRCWRGKPRRRALQLLGGLR